MFCFLWSFLWATLQVNLFKYQEQGHRWLVVELLIPQGHYIYGQNAEEDVVPLDVTVDGIPKDQLHFESPVFDDKMQLEVYKNRAIVLAPIDKTIPKEVKVSYGMCTEIICLPPNSVTKAVNFDQLASPTKDLFERYKSLCLHKKTWMLLPFLLAFLGGMLLNIMPCVLPVLSIKLLSFLAHPETRFRGSVLYGFGNIAAFVTLGMMTGVLNKMGTISGWGFHLQNPLFVFGLACLFVIMIMSVLDLISIPFFQTSTPKSSFLTGIVTVIAGAPCCVPLMSTAVSYGLTQSPLESVLIFAVLGAGMAAPFLLLSIFPVHILPKPGRWLMFVKPTLGFILIVTVLWLLQIYTALTSLDHFLIIGGVLVAMAYTLWLWGSGLFKGWIALVLGISIVGVGVIQTLHRPLPSVMYSESVLKKTVNDGKNVLIYATAKWCLTCKINGAILAKKSVQQAFKDSNTLLIKADYTGQAEDITALLRKYNLAGVPATILLSGDEVTVLPEILTESIVLKALEDLKEKT